MYDQAAHLAQQAILHNQRNSALQASQLYERMANRVWLRGLRRKLRGSSARLLDLNVLKARWTVRDAHSAGVRSVPLSRIVGSEGRTRDFDRRFLPLNPANRLRWIGLAEAWLRGVSLPPVDLIQVGDVYFVRDGHHRISVAYATGQAAIDATLTVWEVNGLPDGLPAAG